MWFAETTFSPKEQCSNWLVWNSGNTGLHAPSKRPTQPKTTQHLGQVLPAAYLADLDKTYMEAGSDPMDPKAMADTLLRLYEVKGKYLQLLSEKAGGGFEPEWYWRLLEQTREKLGQVAEV